MQERIIFLLNSPYPYYTGGRETWINTVCNRLVEYYNIDIVTQDEAVHNVSDGVWTNIDARIQIIAARNVKSFRWMKPFLRSYLVYLNNIWLTYSMTKLIKRRLQASQNTYIISMDTVFLPIVAMRIKKKAKNCVINIVSSRGPHAEIYSSYWPLFKKRILEIERMNFNGADMIWANGYDTQQNIREKGFDSTVIYNGVDCRKFIEYDMESLPYELRSAHPLLFTIGSLLDLKGYPEMIKAVGILHSEYQVHAHLYVYGKGDSSRYKQMAAELGVDAFVHFMGERRGAAAFAKAADVSLALGTSEGSGMSMAALELMTAGTPVVAWDNPCYQQIITNNENGLLVPERNVEKLVETIAFLLKNPDVGKQLGIRAQESVRCNDWDEVIKMIQDQLCNITSIKE